MPIVPIYRAYRAPSSSLLSIVCFCGGVTGTERVGGCARGGFFLLILLLYDPMPGAEHGLLGEGGRHGEAYSHTLARA